MKKKSIILLFLILFLVLVGWYYSGVPLYHYLSFYKPLPTADLLIAEGWLDKEELGYVANLFREGDYQFLITTGYPLKQKLLMYKNGIYKLEINKPPSPNSILVLTIQAQGTLSFDHASVFKVYINKEQIARDSVGKQPKTFSYRLIQHDTIKNVSIRFTNDAIIAGEDRNLWIYSLEINNDFYSALDTNATYSICTLTDSSVFNLAGTQALLARNIILQEGLPKERVIAVSGTKPGISKTLSTAQHTIHAIDSMFSFSEHKINIVSIPPHSRRTYISYCKYYPKESIGIIAVPKSYRRDNQISRIKNLRELSGILLIKLCPGL